MSRDLAIRCIDDIRAIEQNGLDAYLRDKTPFAIIEATSRATPDAVAMLYLKKVGDDDVTSVVTYGAFASRIRRAANLFRSLGVDEESSVAILAPHVESTQVALWAAQVAGRACPINPMLRPDHVISLLKAANCRVAVVQGSNRDIAIWETLVPALRDAGILDHILYCDADEPTSGSDGCFEDLCDAQNDELDFGYDGDPDRIVAFFHTGGTTGAPKLAMHSGLNEAFVARSAAAMYALKSDDVVVNGFPLFHVAGSFVYGLSAFFAGASILIPTRLGMRNRAFVDRIWRKVAQYGVTAIGGVPTVISALNAVSVDADISSLRVMLTGGSTLPSELADAFELQFNKPVRNILGMTECAGVVTVEPFLGARCPGSTGLRLPFTRVEAVRDPVAGEAPRSFCAPGETGVIALSGPHIAPGYSDASKNTGVFEPEGWLVSGDLGHIDDEGRVFVTGRAKDVIIRGAHNIDPAMIEDALLQHPDVSIAAAVGQPDPYAGELPVAYVTIRPGAIVTPDELLTFVQPLVPEQAAVPKTVTILQEMPLTPVGKIFKPALRQIALRQALTERIAKVGLRADQASIDIHDDNVVIRLPEPEAAKRLQAELVGMPIKLSIQVQ